MAKILIGNIKGPKGDTGPQGPQGNIDNTVPTTDSTVASVKPVPENSLPYAEVKEIGGMTRKCTNLTTAQAVYEGAHRYLETVVDGRNCIRFTSGTVIRKTPISFKPNTQYTVSFYAKGEDYEGATTTNLGFVFFYEDGTYSGISVGINSPWTLFSLTSDSGKNVVSVGIQSAEYRADVYLDTDTFMLNEGTEPLPYESFFEGLRSAPVTEVESVGKNHASINSVKAPFGRTTIFEGEVSGDFVLSWDDSNLTQITYPSAALFEWTFKDGSTGSSVAISEALKYSKISGTIVKIELLEWCDAKGGSVDKIQFERGIERTPYHPYVRNTLPITEAVRNLDGYGWGVNDEVYNYIDWEKKQFVKRVERVDLGTLIFGEHELVASLFGATLSKKSSTYDGTILCNALTDKYERDIWHTIESKDKQFGLFEDSVRIYDADYTDAATFKAAMSGVMLVYELATPEITDISDLLPSDNLIGVEALGDVTLVTEYGYDVPNTIVFYEGANEIIGADTLVGDLVGTAARAKYANVAKAAEFAKVQSPSISCLRNSKLVNAETNPTVNGEICWTYK